MQKKKLILLTAILTCSLLLFTGCRNEQSLNTDNNNPSSSGESSDEKKHEHLYTETITKEATCLETGEKTFTCECGDTYTEPVDTVGHNYDVYVYNEDATIDSDGTETALCTICSTSDTRTAENTKLPNLYGMVFEDVSWYNHFCMEDTDIYYEPSFGARVIGHLNINDPVRVVAWAYNENAIYNYPPFDKTESPLEVSWDRIEFDGQIGYIPDKYTWRVQRDTSVTLHPLAANYPDIEGNGSGLFYPPNDGKWYYVYGASSGTPNMLVSKNPYCESMKIYDGQERNVLETVTDPNVKFKLTGRALCTYYNDRIGSYYIYEIEYNGGIAYIDSLTAVYE